MYDNHEKINTCANSVHYTGLDFCRGLYEPSTSFSKNEEVGAISGCSFAIRREVFKELGGFDPDFFLYLEDVDLSWRARLAGHRIMFVSASVVYHKFRLSIAPWKEFYLEHAVLNGYSYMYNKLKANFWILTNPGKIMKKRHDAQMNRRINDKEFIKLLEWKIPFEQVIQNRIMYIAANKIFNSFFWIYYKLLDACLIDMGRFIKLLNFNTHSKNGLI